MFHEYDLFFSTLEIERRIQFVAELDQAIPIECCNSAFIHHQQIVIVIPGEVRLVVIYLFGYKGFFNRLDIEKVVIPRQHLEQVVTAGDLLVPQA